MTLLNRYAGSEIREQKTLDTKLDTSQPFIADIDEHWVTFGNIKCYDSRDEFFEAYPKIQLSRTLIGIAEQVPVPNTFLPSMPLLCQLLMTLYDNKCYTLLEEFDAACIDSANIPLNTRVNYVDNTLIHYPSYIPHAHPYLSNICIPFDEVEISVAQTYFNATRDGISPLCMSYFQNVTGSNEPNKLVAVFSSMEKNLCIHIKSRRYSSNVIETLSLTIFNGKSYNLELNSCTFGFGKGFRNYHVPFVRIPQNDIAQ